MGLREPSSREVALEDAAGCPACLSPRGDGVRRSEEVDFEEEGTDEGRDGYS